MAMIAKARGVDLNPWSLNEHMTDNGLSTHHGVRWDLINAYTNYKTGLQAPVIYPEKGAGVSLPTIGGCLDQGAFVVAHVMNPNTGHGHFMVVTGKIGSDYSVLDPDGDREKQSVITCTQTLGLQEWRTKHLPLQIELSYLQIRAILKNPTEDRVRASGSEEKRLTERHGVNTEIHREIFSVALCDSPRNSA
jgi:hypothetical protein